METEKHSNSFLNRKAEAFAILSGNEHHPQIRGKICFYRLPECVLVCAEITGLPKTENPCKNPVFAFHIHEGNSCTGNQTDPFANAGGHYNPNGCPHPYHAGDMPPLFGVNGTAFLAFTTNRFTIPEIIGKTVIIHAQPDDFSTQPSGNAGEKIACGLIQ